MSDGAAAVLITSEDKASELNLEPMALVRQVANATTKRAGLLGASTQATEAALGMANLRIDEIDLVDISESYASVAVGWQMTQGIEFDKMNVNGGAISLGEPGGAGDVRMLTTLVHAMRRRSVDFGLYVAAGGLGATTLLLESA